MEEQTLFQVDQLVETRSFQPGYRGAWFNCKIVFKKGDAVSLKYCDFPDEKLHWTKIYQKPQGRKATKGKKELMLRPPYPPIYRESQLRNASTIPGLAVVVKDDWCVGDLVDWKFDDCYWCGKITEVLGNGKYQIDLLPHPFGEGESYEGSGDQLRPSLEWSPQKDWTLSTPPPVPGWKNCCSPARLINHTKQEGSTKTAHTVDSRKKEVEGNTDAVPQPNILFLSTTSPGSLPPSKETKTAEKDGNIDVKDGGVSRPNFFAGISSLQARKASMKPARDSSENGNQHDGGPSKRLRTGGNFSLNFTNSDSMEAASLDLEDLVNKVKWIKGILQFGLPNSPRSWKFIEHRQSSMPK